MDHSDVSFWLADAGDLTPRPPLRGDVEVDVAIVGAGFTGLWTAWALLDRAPGLRIALCESQIVGYGASGRNGTWCSAGLGTSPAGLARRFGPDAARRVVLAMRDTVDHVGRTAADAGIDAGFHKGGTLRLARGAHQVDAVRSAHAALAGLDLLDGHALLDRAAVSARVRVTDAHGALFDPHCATLHPGRLVRGLGRAVERRGAVVYEGTAVTDLRDDRRSRAATPRPVLVTPSGRLRAGAALLATEAWTARMPGHRRAVLPVYSLIVLTEPLSDQQWRAIGWEGHETLASQRLTVDYLARTADGRILLGGRGAPYHYGSRIAARFDRHAATHATLERMVGEWFPPAADARIAWRWGGPLGMPRDFLPTVAWEPATGFGGAWGYTGQGVAASHLTGRILADLVTDRASDLTRLPLAGHRSRRWEPEPLRWLAARYVQRAFARLDARAARTGRAPSGASVAERLMRR